MEARWFGCPAGGLAGRVGVLHGGVGWPRVAEFVDGDGFVAAGAEAAETEAVHEGAAVVAALSTECAGVAVGALVDGPRWLWLTIWEGGVGLFGWLVAPSVGGDSAGFAAVAAFAGSWNMVPQAGHGIFTRSLLDGFMRRDLR